MNKHFLNEIEAGSRSALVKKSIINYFIYNGSSTLTDLSKELNLSVPTVTKFVGEMCEEGFINDYGKLETNGGRHPNIYGLNPESGYFIGVDMQTDGLDIGLVNFKGDMVELKMDIPYTFENTRECMDQVCGIITDFIDHLDVDKSNILNLNLNISGRVNPDEFYVFKPTLQQGKRPIVSKRLGSKEIEQIRAALLALQKLPAGQAFFESTGYLGYEPVSNTDIASMQPYIAITRNVLNTKSLPSP